MKKKVNTLKSWEKLLPQQPWPSTRKYCVCTVTVPGRKHVLFVIVAGRLPTYHRKLISSVHLLVHNGEITQAQTDA